jgi:hypothetical protein
VASLSYLERRCQSARRAHVHAPVPSRPTLCRSCRPARRSELIGSDGFVPERMAPDLLATTGVRPPTLSTSRASLDTRTRRSRCRCTRTCSTRLSMPGARATLWRRALERSWKEAAANNGESRPSRLRPKWSISRLFPATAADDERPGALPKLRVAGSNPVVRSKESPAQAGFSLWPVRPVEAARRGPGNRRVTRQPSGDSLEHLRRRIGANHALPIRRAAATATR